MSKIVQARQLSVYLSVLQCRFGVDLKVSISHSVDSYSITYMQQFHPVHRDCINQLYPVIGRGERFWSCYSHPSLSLVEIGYVDLDDKVEEINDIFKSGSYRCKACI